MGGVFRGGIILRGNLLRRNFSRENISATVGLSVVNNVASVLTGGGNNLLVERPQHPT